MKKPKAGLSRRRFMQGSAAGIAAFTIVPRNVLGMGETPPSDQIGGALIGCGGRGPGTFQCLGPNVRRLPGAPGEKLTDATPSGNRAATASRQASRSATATALPPSPASQGPSQS